MLERARRGAATAVQCAMFSTSINLMDLTSQDAVRLPRVLHYDASMHVLVPEDPRLVTTLKAWIAYSTDVFTSRSFETVLGCFLANVHKLQSADQPYSQNFM